MSNIFQKSKKALDKLSIIPNIAFANIYFSQTGEDIILKEIFYNKKIGFYVDIGAHHPKRFSNTYLLYKKGWSGINIDADKRSIDLFNEERTRDKNIHCAISNKEQKLNFYTFLDGAINTLDKKEANSWSKARNEKPKVKKLKTKRLETILDQNLPKDTPIDFFSIDIEGYDLEALKSNNWKKYSPNYILIEMFGSPFKSKKNKQKNAFLEKQGYELIAKTTITSVYKKISI